jgi:hypothetical protein
MISRKPMRKKIYPGLEPLQIDPDEYMRNAMKKDLTRESVLREWHRC